MSACISAIKLANAPKGDVTARFQCPEQVPLLRLELRQLLGIFLDEVLGLRTKHRVPLQLVC